MIGLSCDEAGLLSPNTAPQYNLTMNIIESNALHYADSCQGCQDPNPIEIQVTLKNNTVPVSDSEIIFTYESTDISISDPFDDSSVNTSNSGIATAKYNDNGKIGTMQITATYINPSYPDTVWSETSNDIEILPYYDKETNSVKWTHKIVMPTENNEIINSPEQYIKNSKELKENDHYKYKFSIKAVIYELWQCSNLAGDKLLFDILKENIIT